MAEVRATIMEALLCGSDADHADVSIRERSMPKHQLRLSAAHSPETKLLKEENLALRKEVSDLRAQLSAVRVGIKAIMDTIATPDEGFEP